MARSGSYRNKSGERRIAAFVAGAAVAVFVIVAQDWWDRFR